MGFLSAFADWYRAETDAPDRFGEWAALAVLAVAASPKAWVQFGSRQLRPNLWILLLAPSGAYRKSTAISLACSILAAHHGVIYPAEFSPEAIVAILAEKPAGLFAWREYRAIAGLFEREYASSAKAILADLYDPTEEYTRATKSGEITIRNPAISILSASNLEWLQESVAESDAGSGWLARFCLVPAKSRERCYALPPEDLDRARFAQTMAGLRWAINGMREGARRMAGAARQRYETWYRTIDKRAMESANAAPALVRLAAVCLKLSLLYSIERGATEIEPGDVDRAIGTTDWLATQAEEFYGGDTVSPGKDAANRRRILDAVHAVPTGIGRGPLLRATGLAVRAFDGALETLIARGDVTRIDGAEDPSRWKPGIWYLPGKGARR